VMARRCSWVGATGPTSTPCRAAAIVSGGSEAQLSTLIGYTGDIRRFPSAGHYDR
jgi:hypothetical protein